MSIDFVKSNSDRGTNGRNVFLFALMSLIWGTTWIAAKAGVSAVPPVFFAAARFTFAACLFIPVLRSVGAAFAKPLVGRVVLTGILLNVVTYILRTAVLGYEICPFGNCRCDEPFRSCNRLIRICRNVRSTAA